MESIGRSYRLMVEGLIDVLRARASLKGEFRMQQTMIQPAENNPLKFAPNADEALLLLLRHGNQAFMAPDVAVREFRRPARSPTGSNGRCGSGDQTPAHAF